METSQRESCDIQLENLLPTVTAGHIDLGWLHTPVSYRIYTNQRRVSYHNFDSFGKGDSQYVLTYTSRFTYAIQVVPKDCTVGLVIGVLNRSLYQLIISI